jgi:hypothetical protein
MNEIGLTGGLYQIQYTSSIGVDRLFFAAFPSNALAGQSLVVGHGSRWGLGRAERGLTRTA